MKDNPKQPRKSSQETIDLSENPLGRLTLAEFEEAEVIRAQLRAAAAAAKTPKTLGNPASLYPTAKPQPTTPPQTPSPQ